MSRPTPETDEYTERDWWTLFRANEHSRKLERERDEARESLKHIEEYGTEEINAAVELRQKLAQALVDLDNMQDQRDLAMKVIKRLEQERDEALESASFEGCFQKLERERDEARSAIANLNQRLQERQESFQAQLIRIEDVWREKLTESRKDADRLYNCLLEVGVYELDEHYYVSNVLAQHEELVRNG